MCERRPARAARWTAVGCGRRVVDRQPDLFDSPAELAVQLLPLAHAEEVEEFSAAKPAKLVRAQLGLPLLEVVPEPDDRQEVGVGIGKPSVAGVGRITLIHGPLAWVLDRELSCDDEQLPEGALTFCLEKHAPETWVDREPGQPPTDVGESPPAGPLGCLQCPELLQQRHAVPNGTEVGRIDERERRDVAEVEGGHPQG